MEDNPNNNSDGSGAPPVADTNDELKGRIAGLDRKVTDLAIERDFLKGRIQERDGLVAKASTQITELTEKLASFDKQLSDIQAARDAAIAEAATYKSAAERTKLFMSEYSDLAHLEHRGLVPPTLNGEELTKYLTGMREVIKSASSDAAGKALGGHIPAAGAAGSNTSMDIATLEAEMSKAIAAGDVKRFSELNQEFLSRVGK
jgi:hypothetical protein